MRVLLDENMPQRFRLLLSGHEVFTSRYMGWDGKTNGDLIAAMKAQGFHALVTYDKALPSQQNLQTAGIGVIVITRRRSYTVLRSLAPEILRVLQFLQPGQVVNIPTPS